MFKFPVQTDDRSARTLVWPCLARPAQAFQTFQAGLAWVGQGWFRLDGQAWVGNKGVPRAREMVVGEYDLVPPDPK